VVVLAVLAGSAIPVPRMASAQTDALSHPENFPDRVIVQPRYSTGKKGIRCRVIDYTGTSVIVRQIDANTDSHFPTSQVTRVETPQVKPHREGLQLLAEGETAAAEEKLKEALRIESREWVRREILAVLVRAALSRGDYVTAATRLEMIYLSDKSTHHLELLPAVWSRAVLTPEQIRNANELAIGETDVMQLVGASILLFEPGFETSSKKTLLRISQSGDTRLQPLAEAQLWRLELEEKEVSAFKLDSWRRHVERLPASLRGGPYFLLAEAYRFKILRDEAALTYLRIPVLYDHDRLLAAEACLAAADVFQRQGRLTEAVAMYRELLARYQGTEASRKADAVLKSMTESS
jgi:signal peptidase II